MLIALYFFIVNVVLPQLGDYAQSLVQPVLSIVITLAGIAMLFAAVGMKISNNMGSTVVDGIFRVIGYVVQNIFRAIGWIVRNTFGLTYRAFNASRRVFGNSGMSDLVSNLLAALIAVIVLVIII